MLKYLFDINDTASKIVERFSAIGLLSVLHYRTIQCFKWNICAKRAIFPLDH
jgi:hypothetical protein